MPTVPGTILSLNGASSAGKSSLLTALQLALREPYLEAGMDKFIFMLPARYLNRPLWDDILGLAVSAGAHGHQLFAGMHQAQAALARAGNNVLADHVLVEPAWVAECAALFADLPAYLIGVRCPLEVLEAREQARADRTLGQARAQFARVHAHGEYDLEVDTHTHSPAECAAQIVAYLASGAPPRAWRALRA
jgi:chloramphenicol 3-O phosphotransferase